MLPSAVQWSELDATEQDALLQRPARVTDAVVGEKVRSILRQVRANGDEAVLELTRRIDGVSLGAVRVSDAELQQAERELSPRAIDAIDMAIANVRRFHLAQRAAPIAVHTMPGVLCERVSHAIESVGLYVPAGTAPLPSAAIMLAVPAAIADCPQRVLCTPPRADGRADSAVLVAAKRAGVHSIFKVGGAQAIAAMAYGTASVPRVCKIFGPGNVWVTLAKTMVSADPDGAAIDMPAGPSEVLIIADDTASASFVAADLLSQAEHGVDSQVILVTTSTALATQVNAQLELQIKNLSRSSIAEASLAKSHCIVVKDVATAIQISNAYAPEHLLLQCAQARDWLPLVRNAGSIFVGPWSPEAVGDYCSGTNHVLPTHGFARAYSGLGVDQFLRYMTVQELTADGLSLIADSVIELARLEGLDAHAAAVKCRQAELR